MELMALDDKVMLNERLKLPGKLVLEGGVVVASNFQRYIMLAEIC